MKKKLLIIIATAGLISFGGTFFLGLKTTRVPQTAEAAPHLTADVNKEAELKLSAPLAPESGLAVQVDNTKKIAMTEKHLKDLVYEVREKINDYDFKLQELELREKNLQVARDTLRKDVNELDNLRIELTATVSAIKSEQEKLQKTMLQISITEENNLKAIAATYDKMDASQAGKILVSMSQNSKGSNADDAVKILYYMTERTKAKVLASIAETEPAISAYFCQRLKKISVKE